MPFVTDKSGRSFRGTVSKSVDDVIEEAPFTKVDDIEKNIAQEPEASASQPTEEPVIAEPVDEQAEEPGSDEVIEEAAAEIKETEEIVQDAAESPIAEEETDHQETSDNPEPDKNNDLPSFE